MLLTFKFSQAQDFLSVGSSNISYFSLKNENHFKTELTIVDNFEIGFDDNEFEKILKQKLNQPYWEYQVRKGDTLWSLSKKFKVKIEDLMLLNNLSSEGDLKYDLKIKIPGKKEIATTFKNQSQPQPQQSYFGLKGKYVSALTSLGTFLVPVSGYNWGERHSNNATDISAPCGEPAYASQSGYVVISRDGWNNGYGNYIVIYHEGYSTLYGHLSLRTVEEGEYVEKGDLIGYVGNTGYVKGITGCHLHFEVRGMANPLLY